MGWRQYMSENLRMETLRRLLCNIFFENEEYIKYIVPLQGNWYNPVADDSVGDTWIGYVIDYTNFTSAAIRKGDRIIRSGSAVVHLSFIGKQAESMAYSTVFWPYRVDIQSAFKSINGVLNNKDIRVFTSLYMQEGVASTLCYNVNLTIAYNEELEIASEYLRNVDISGDLIVN